MPEIKLDKKYPHIKDEDVINIYLEGYIKGFETGRKGAIPIAWIDSYITDSEIGIAANDPISIKIMVEDWQTEQAYINAEHDAPGCIKENVK